MDYAVFGVLGSAILSIINHDILYHRDPENESQAHHYYWVFLVAVLFYFATDVLWGLFRGAGATGPQYAATVAEFVPGTDTDVKMVFDRADQKMYERKRELKLQS